MHVVWFRNDLRTTDHAALTAALAAGPAVAVFLWAGQQWRSHDVGPPRLAFLRRCLESHAAELDTLNVPLLVLDAPVFADAPELLARLCSHIGATTVHAIEEFPLNERVRDSAVANRLAADGVRFELHEGGAILPPGAVMKDGGNPYTVFTPFKRRWAAQLHEGARTPLPKPAAQPQQPRLPRQWPELPLVTSNCLNLKQAFDGIDADLFATHWPGGAPEAQRRLAHFAEGVIEGYATDRDLAAEPGTSALSPYLSIGALSGRTALALAMNANGGRLLNGADGPSIWITELVWRDFYRHVIVHFPHVSKHRAFKPDTENVPWRTDPEALAAWQEGRTGYPMVDAGMRQLNGTGWMHNRLRMICAMFLSKHLLLDWRRGERYFMERLVDGDFAANNGGWQWSASTGTDAVPYFRIFNPTTQAERFDPQGTFIRTWVPELDALAPLLEGRRKKQFFEPWSAAAPPAGYPTPIVDHKQARERALAAFKGL